MDKMTVYIDTREKYPWSFPADNDFNDSISHKLDTGDYSIQGYEHILCIERKRTVSELVQNMFEKRFPVGCRMPKQDMEKMSNVKTPQILGFISSMTVNYGIYVLLAGDTKNANYLANRIMKRVHERESIRTT